VIVFDLVGDDEHHATYRALTAENCHRQYSFLRSVVEASLAVGRPFLSSQVLKALNFQAIACLHAYAGEYRPCQVFVGDHEPPPHYRVQALMDDFVNTVNREWEAADSVGLAAFVLWRLNWIHPFINGNGRTARAACYFVLCVKAEQWLSGATILPELILREQRRYELGLRHADESMAAGAVDLSPLHALLVELLEEQIAGAPTMTS
jgi:fido (protein-threonine AMPylation protein)